MRQATLARKPLPDSMLSTRPALVSCVQERPVPVHAGTRLKASDGPKPALSNFEVMVGRIPIASLRKP